MPDLGTAKGFAAATGGLSAASNALNLLTGLNNETWDIQESSYGHGTSVVKFHIFESSFAHSLGFAADYNGAVDSVQDNIAKRIVPFRFPYVDGQTTDDLGREGESFDFNILLFGNEYYKAYKALIEEFNKKEPGDLIHPVRGPIRVKFENATVTHKSSERKAVTLRVRFVEHNFEIKFKDPRSSFSLKSLLGIAVGLIAVIANIVNTVNSALTVLSIFRSAIKTATKNYQDAYTQTLIALNVTFNNGSSSDLPGLLPANSPTGSTAQNPNNSFPTGGTPNDKFAGLNLSQIQAQQSAVLSSLHAIDLVKSMREQANTLIAQMSSAPGVDPVTGNSVAGLGSIIFYNEILQIKQSQIALQKVLESGLKSSNIGTKNFTVPRLMSIREICFANNIDVDRSSELEQLNPSILSYNFIEKGSIVQVPIS